jgi:hypothetical protein
MHGSFSRADTWNFMAARGPDFRTHYVDELPASNADIGVTIAHLLRLDLALKGKLLGRVLEESLRDDSASNPEGAHVTMKTLESRPGAHGLKTILKTESVGSSVYLDAAGFAGRSVGVQ